MMAEVICLHDRQAIEAFLRRDTFNNLYALGDLDDFFWPYTTWYARMDEGKISQLALLYSGLKPPVLLAFHQGNSEATCLLLQAIKHLLPDQFYAHLSAGLAEVFASQYSWQSFGLHDKMGLTEPVLLAGSDTSAVVRLSPANQRELEELYQQSYADNWFDPRMLQTGQYYGLRQNGNRLISVAGVHVYSRRYRVAALGNIATHPEHRGKGLCQIVTARLCRELVSHIDHIGLNVRTDNHAAIACYTKLGFQRIGGYEEYLFTAKKSADCAQ